MVEVGEWDISSRFIFAADPITLGGTDRNSIFVPQGSARIVSFLTGTGDAATSLGAFWGAGGTLSCGQIASVVPVESGRVAFMDLAAILAANGAMNEPTTWSRFREMVTDIPARAVLVTLGSESFPISGAGTGNDLYPVWEVFDDNGALRGVWVEFIPMSGRFTQLPLC